MRTSLDALMLVSPYHFLRIQRIQIVGVLLWYDGRSTYNPVPKAAGIGNVSAFHLEG